MKPYLAIDLRELKRKDTGIGRWTRNFLSVKKKYAARLNIVGFGATTPGVDVAVAAPRLGMSGLNLNLQLEQMEAGLWMSPYYKIPPGLKIPCIGTVHDTIPSRKFPGNVLFNNRLKYSLDHAKLIVTVSDAVRRELIEEYGVSEDRVILARNSVNDEFCSKPKRGDVKMLAGLGLKKGGYRLAVIDDRPHKNLDVLIKAFADDPETPFVIVGTKRTDLPAHFKTLSGLGDDVLKVLYRYTSLFFHPAFEEGFGLPALEAMASGAELILSDIPPMREIAGGAAIYVDPSDPQAWRQATQSVDGSVAKREMGEERTKMFRAERTYQHLWENINQLLSVPAKKPSIKVSRPLVLHVHTLPWVGGSGLNTFFSMKYLDQSKYRTGLACAPGGRLEEKVRQEGFPFYAVENLCAEVAPLNDLLVSGELVRLFRKLKPSIIHTHNSKAGFVGRLAAQFCPEAHVVHTVHGFSFHDEETMMRKTVFKNLEKLAFRWADAHASISPTLIDWAEREKIGTAQDYELVWSGIEVDAFLEADRREGRKILGLGDNEIAVGLVSKLWEGKGHEFLIEALKPILSQNLKIVFIGEGPLEERLRSIANEHVIFAGFQTDIPTVTAALDIAVLPSDFEGMGRVLLEAQAAAVPVVANRIGGMVDIVTNGGILLGQGDHAAWCDEVSDLANSSSMRKHLGEKGREFVSEKFSVQKMAKDLEKIYDRLLDSE